MFYFLTKETDGYYIPSYEQRVETLNKKHPNWSVRACDIKEDSQGFDMIAVDSNGVELGIEFQNNSFKKIRRIVQLK